MTRAEAIAAFKLRERPETVLLAQSDARLRALLVAWLSVGAVVDLAADCDGTWAGVWQGAALDEDTLAELSGLDARP